MNDELAPVIIQRAMEQLRQERDSFNQAKFHDNCWFFLRLIAGYSAIIILSSIAIFSIYVIGNYSEFPTAAVTSACAAIFIDILGVATAVWKITVAQPADSKLSPVTRSSIPEIIPARINEH